MRIFTLNIRNRSDGGKNTIPKRARRLFDMIKKLSPDVITLQECTPLWMLCIRGRLHGEYAIYNAYRGGDAESLCILWKKSKLSCVKKGFFRLSDNPSDRKALCFERRYNCRRITSYALLKDKATGAEFLTADIHFGFDEPERVKSAHLTARCLRQITDASTVIAGDMNADTRSPSYAVMTENYVSAGGSDDTPTYHGYGRGTPVRIDHIFVSRDVRVKDCRVAGTDDEYVSDHYGIYADIEL